MAKQRPKRASNVAKEGEPGAAAASVSLTWLKATYEFHTFAYRDPRAAFSSAVGLPVVSPTAALLGIASTLFNSGRADDAREFLRSIHRCRALIDPPDGMVLFRAFHQVRRYVSGIMKGKKKEFVPPARLGFTQIEQATREYGLPSGPIALFVAVPEDLVEPARVALRNRDHLGTHDSLCSLVGDVEDVREPKDIVFLSPEEWQGETTPVINGVTVLTLARFKGPFERPTVGNHWWMAGGDNTELVPYLVKGTFRGTTRGKIYYKNPPG